MNIKIITTVFLFLISIPVSSSEDVYCGKYKSVKSKCKISFDLTDCGVTNLSVNKIKIDTTSIEWYYFVRYGSTQIFEIDFSDGEYNYNMMLFIVEIERGVFWATGFYMQYKSNDDYGIILKKQVLELKWKPIKNCFDC